MQILRAADRVATPWKNGGGVTREVAAWPPGSGFDDFHWRVSMAEVRADAPFSVFAGVDRILAVLEGRLALSVEGLGAFDLARDSVAARFPGDAPTTGRVVEGPVLDLNIMTRRGKTSAHLQRLSVAGPRPLPASPGYRLLVAGRPMRADGHGLARYDALLLDAAPPALVLYADPPTTAYLVTFAGQGQPTSSRTEPSYSGRVRQWP